MDIAEEYDLIDKLPTDKNAISTSEYKVLNNLFKHPETTNLVFSEFKDAIVAGILFAIFSIGYIDTLIYKVIPSLKNFSPFYLIGIKALFIIVIFFVLKHFFLLRKI